MFKGNTSRFKVTTVLYDNDGFIVAEGEWTEPATGEKTTEIGCRWAGEGDDIGYPQTYGKPQWMIIPKELGLMWKAGIPIIEFIKRKAA